MSQYKSIINLSFFIIFLLLSLLVSSLQNESLYNELKNFNEMKDIKTEPELEQWPGPGPQPDPHPETDDEDWRKEIDDKIFAAELKKEKLGIDKQKKEIYAIALGVLAGIFLLLIIIYVLFKCGLFCISRNELKRSTKRIRISKIGEVFLEENYDSNNNDIHNPNNINSDNYTNDKNSSFYSNDNNNNGAPPSFNTNSRGNTFDPDNYNPPNEEEPMLVTPVKGGKNS